MTVFEGDFFELTAAALGPVDLVFDRAALVALTPAVRERYSARMIDMTRVAPQLLISFEYPQAQMQGPPFSVAEPELTHLYGRDYDWRSCIARRLMVAPDDCGLIACAHWWTWLGD